LQRVRRTDDPQTLARAASVEGCSRERADGRDVRAADVADVAVHVSKTGIPAETHLT
jgi:hypothetical protein